VSLTASITKRRRKRRLTSGAVITQVRFVVNFREPRSGRRQQFFFTRYQEAAAKRDALLSSIATNTYVDPKGDLTVAQAVAHWLEARRSEVKNSTWDHYRHLATYIVGPLLEGTALQRQAYTRTGMKPAGAQLLDMLGPTRVGELTTADIRRWHRDLSLQVSAHTASGAKKVLNAALVMAAEDHGLRVPPMPSRIGRGRSRPKKAILTPDQVGLLLDAAHKDTHRGLYYAFPFLTGVRPSEQLGLLWDDIDFGAGVIHIRRMQEEDGALTEFTKTAAGMRDIPISSLLRAMLLRWRPLCPHTAGTPNRVFPALGSGHLGSRRHPFAGRALSYRNFLASYWRPALLVLGLPYVTPHSARHAFISTLQAQGIEVGLVAKLAGHANATVTLAHYTQAVRGGEGAVEALLRAYKPRLEAPSTPGV
jgi:integrase